MITLLEAKSHLRIDGSNEDGTVRDKLMQARAIVAQYVGPAYLGTTFATVTLAPLSDDPGWNPPSPFTWAPKPAVEGEPPFDYEWAPNTPASAEAVLDAAVLLVLGELWANRESTAALPLSPSVRNLLDLLRGPVIA